LPSLTFFGVREFPMNIVMVLLEECLLNVRVIFIAFPDLVFTVRISLYLPFDTVYCL